VMQEIVERILDRTCRLGILARARTATPLAVR